MNKTPAVRQPTNVIEFATGSAFLGLKLFPRQATVIKLLCLALDLITPYDRDVIEEWAGGFTATDHIDGARWSGYAGIVPDVLERAESCVRAGRWTWHEIVLVLGRRGSKSLLASIVIAWQLWRLLSLDDPQAHFGLPPTKRIVLLAYSASRETAKRDLFGDLVARLRDSPCFKPFIDHVGDTSITLYTPAQLRRGDRTTRRRGLIEISAAPTTTRSARGPAAFALVIDEAAHLDGAGSTSSTEELLTAARPALAQFDGMATTILPSSPWTMTGGFYESFVQACAIDPITGTSLNPARFALQLPSWSLYLDHERTHEIEMWPGGPAFEPIDRPILSFGDFLEGQQRNNPETFAVEFESQFTSGVSRYLTEATVTRLFAPWQRPISGPRRPDTDRHVIHCDPSTSGANFAVAIGHLVDDGDERHVVFDRLHAWRPADFDEHRVDYNVVHAELLDLIDLYRPTALHFDDHNVAFFLDRLAPEVQRRKLRTTVSKVTTTRVEKFERFEHFKTLANQDLIHAPAHPLAIQEARFIQAEGLHIGHPTSGPCRTDDLIDAMTWVVRHLLGRNSWVPEHLADVRLGASRLPSPFDAFYDDRRRRPDTNSYNPASQPRWHPSRRGH